MGGERRQSCYPGLGQVKGHGVMQGVHWLRCEGLHFLWNPQEDLKEIVSGPQTSRNGSCCMCRTGGLTAIPLSPNKTKRLLWSYSGETPGPVHWCRPFK